MLLKEQFNCNEDSTNPSFVFSDINFTFTKENDSRISIVTNEIKLYLESGSTLLNKCNNDFFEEHINLAHHRVAVITELDYINSVTTHIPRIFELLHPFFHTILVNQNEHILQSHVDDLSGISLLLENVIINEDTFLCFCEPSSII